MKIRILDEKFKEHKMKYFSQCGLATLSMLIVLILLDIFMDAAVIAALGASCFIVFILPHTDASRPRFLIGGYLSATLVAFLCHLANLIYLTESLGISHRHTTIIIGSIAVGFTMLLMVVTNSEHPPAVGLALGLVVDGFNYKTVGVVLAGILIISIVRAVLKPYIINLL